MKYTSELLIFFYEVLKSAVLEIRKGRRIIFSTTIRQIYFTGFEALPIVSITSLALGAVLITQSTTILTKFGLGSYVEKMIVQITIRELSPLILALIVIGRSGTAISTELGNMKLNREFQALEVMGISLTHLIILPRILGMIIAFICLSIYFNIIAVFGGYLILNSSQILTPSIWVNCALNNIYLPDLYVSAVKSSIFGLTISLITTYHGISVKESFTEVPQVATKGVVNSIVFCFCINLIITLFLFPLSSG